MTRPGSTARKRPARRALLAAALLVTLSAARAVPLHGEVTGLEIEERQPFAAGHPFGSAGAYERITGKLRFEVDPGDPANARISDLQLAPRNGHGNVELWSEFFLLKPVDPLRGNRCLLYGVNNRGNKLMLGAFNDAGGNDPSALADAGNGFLFRQGYALLWCGWNGDVKPGGGRLLIGLPVARNPGGTSITGRIHAEICVNEKSFSEPLYWGNSLPYAPVSLDGTGATLSMRPRRSAPAVEVPRPDWAFARWEEGKAVPEPERLHVREGFRPGWLYDLVYTGKDPRVTGLGFAAVRDAVSFFRRERRDRGGGENPLAGAVERAYVFGISQSARFVHHFLYEGFNTDERGRAVFDAALAHVGGAGKGLFNYRFSQTTRHGSHHEDNLYPADFFPFTTVPQEDPVSGERGDVLARARAAGQVPKVFFTLTSTEYWARAGSLLHTDVGGTRDIEPDPNVHIYFFTGAQHGVSRSSERGIYQNPVNVLDHRPLLRALLTALDEWVAAGREPPPSRYPRIADGTLVDLAAYRRGFPAVRGLVLPESFYAPLRLDPGPRWQSEGIADHVPPRVGPPYRTLVPAVDAGGNEVAGVRLPDVAVPLGTYTGWNLRGAGCGAEGMLARWAGSYLPFAITREEREGRGDPRRSVRERYPTRELYLARVTEAALALERERFLLAGDVVEILRAARARRLWAGRAGASPAPR